MGEMGRRAGGWLVMMMLILAMAGCSAETSGRQKRLMDFGWKFRQVDASMPGEGGKVINQWRWKAVEGKTPAAVPAIDGTWKEAKPDQDLFGGRVGYAWCGAVLPELKGAKQASGRVIVFDAVDDNATVYLNGKKVGSHEGWSESFEVQLDSAWKNDGPNVLMVLVENTAGIGGVKGATLKLTTAALAANDYDDRSWRMVNVPHDFVIESPILPEGDPNFGFHKPGVGWYRRHFTVDSAMKGKRVWLEFDGVYRDSRVYLNGKLLGIHPSGYTSFYYDATDAIQWGKENVLAVRVDATSHEGWWYEGGGIYRHVWLTTLDPLHVDHWGTFVTTKIETPLPAEQGKATVSVRTRVVNQGGDESAFVVRSSIVDAAGKTVASLDTESLLKAGKSEETEQKVTIADAQFWSVGKPYLYHVMTTVLRAGNEVDRVVSPLGIREIRFDADHGFFLNGKSVKLQGTCNHQDFAGIGIALPDRVQEYKIEKLKEMGANAYRCSHHQYAEELLDACDRLGMLVMDENRHLGESEQILDEAKTLVLRDRNHPSVILWSICNEEGLQGSAAGRQKAQAIKDVFNQYDGTRPVTAAMNAGWGGEGISNVIDVQGFNYNIAEYDGYHKTHPQQPMMGSETGSILTTRGEYKQDDIRGYVSSYNEGAENSWKPIAQREYMAGAFVWTGFDYRGEPTPFGWPCVNSHFGIMDTCGFPKDDYYYYQAAWTDKPVLHLFPHWNWAYPPRPENEQGGMVEMRCYSNCDKVELFVNGKSQGVKEGKRLGHLSWRVKWNPGEISAKGWKDGKEIEAKVETAGVPAKIVLSANRSTIHADGEDVALVTATVVDAQGRICPMADNAIAFGCSSAGLHILGTGNGDPSDHTPDHSIRRRAFHGKCLAVIQASDQPGEVTVSASTADLPPTMLHLNLQPTALRPRVP